MLLILNIYISKIVIRVITTHLTIHVRCVALQVGRAGAKISELRLRLYVHTALGSWERRSRLRHFAALLAFLPRHENVIEQRSGSNSGFLFAVRADQVIFSVSHSAPTAKEPFKHLGTVGRLRGLAVRPAPGSISRAPGRRHHGRQVRSRGTIQAGGPQLRTE